MNMVNLQSLSVVSLISQIEVTCDLRFGVARSLGLLV
jgi:hypothetical protein